MPSTFVVLWADWQLYKSAAGGIKASTERVLASFDATAKRIQDLQKLGRNIEQIAFVNMGDVTESCDGHYASQLFSVQGTQRQQLLTALDLWTLGVTTTAHLAEKKKFVSVLTPSMFLYTLYILVEHPSYLGDMLLIEVSVFHKVPSKSIVCWSPVFLKMCESISLSIMF